MLEPIRFEAARKRQRFLLPARRLALTLTLLACVGGCGEGALPLDPPDEGTTTDEPSTTTGGTTTLDATTGSDGSTAPAETTAADEASTSSTSGAEPDTTTATETTGTTGDETTAAGMPPDATALELAISPIKQFDFTWPPAEGAEHYQLLESISPGDPYVQLGDDIVGESISLVMPLHLRFEASYVLRACNADGCADSAPVGVVGSLAEAVGYFKASNTAAEDDFGSGMALSDDGNTLAVGAYHEDGGSTGIDGDPLDDSAPNSGAVYVFVRDAGNQWSQAAYIKASNASAHDTFGGSVALSGDGSTLAVGAYYEDGGSTGIDGDQLDDSALASGAAYVFVRDAASQWSQQAYVKASNTDANDLFGSEVALSDDGNTLAVVASYEASGSPGINGNQADDSVDDAGAVYVFTRDAMDQWSQQAYVKASNPGVQDFFGWSMTLSGDGDTLAVGAAYEDSTSTGIDGDQEAGGGFNTGAVYVFTRSVMGVWSQQAYVKASNTGSADGFGWSVALSTSGDTLAVGAAGEDSSALGIEGDQTDDSMYEAGAAYVFTRDAMDQWSQQAYIKATSTDTYDGFGHSLGLSGDGNTLAVSARDDGGSAGLGGNHADESMLNAGAVYVLVRDPVGAWSHRAYVKAPNPGAYDYFGSGVALSMDGSTLAAVARGEASSATGIGGDQTDDSAAEAGAVYLY